MDEVTRWPESGLFAEKVESEEYLWLSADAPSTWQLPAINTYWGTNGRLLGSFSAVRAPEPEDWQTLSTEDSWTSSGVTITGFRERWNDTFPHILTEIWRILIDRLMISVLPEVAMILVIRLGESEENEKAGLFTMTYLLSTKSENKEWRQPD